MKSSYISNFNASDDEDLSGDEYQPTTDVDQGSPRSLAAPTRGYVAPGTPPPSPSGSEGDKELDKKVQQAAKRVVPLPSDDSDSEFDLEDIDKQTDDNTKINTDINGEQTGLETPKADLEDDNQSKSSESELDFGSDIDIDEALERSLHGAYSSQDREGGSSPLQANASNDSLDNQGKRKKYSDDEDDNITPSKKKKKNIVNQDDSLEVKDELDIDFLLSKGKKRVQRRKNKDVHVTNDDSIIYFLNKMQEAAREDQELNVKQQPATSKLSMLPTVMLQLQKRDILPSFIELGLLATLCEWLCPLPDKSLPYVQIRTQILEALGDMPKSLLDKEQLKTSGIGKAVMFLYKHPKETRKNKDKANKLIYQWARPIFGIESNFKTISRDEREERDHHRANTIRKRHSSSGSGRESLSSISDEHLKPGDKGFVSRARVPQPSMRDYVTRPKWNIQTELKPNKVKTPSKKDIMLKDINLKKKSKKILSHAVSISLEGKNMPL